MRTRPVMLACAIAASPAIAESESSLHFSYAEAHAQVVSDTAPEWEITLTPYLWVPAVTGSLRLGTNQIDVSQNVGDTAELIFDNFRFAAELHLEVARDDFFAFADAMYLGLTAEDTPTETGNTDIDFDLGVFALGAGYTVLKRPIGETGELTVAPLAGVRFFYMSVESDPSDGPGVSESVSWLNAIVGGQVRARFHETFSLLFRGDIGAGGSDFAWSALGGAEFRFNSWGTFGVGYRALDVDYDRANFNIDVLFHGPYLALSIRF